jgi:predicted  nucleic acid-binding Zn-ribbon protein
MASDTLVFSARAAMAHSILEQVGRDCPSWRQTNLLVSSLERKIEKFRERFGFIELERALGGKLSKSRQRAMGAELTKLNQQTKKLKASLNKTMEEGFYKEYPNSSATPRRVRRALVGANKQFEMAVRRATTQFRTKVLAAAAAKKELSK